MLASLSSVFFFFSFAWAPVPGYLARPYCTSSDLISTFLMLVKIKLLKFS